MGQPAAKQGDKITATDTHMVVMPDGSTVPQSLPFSGTLDGGLSGDVKIMGSPAATVGSTATNTPSHVQLPPATSFVNPPKNKGTVQVGSATVKINGKPAARNGDKAMTCNDPTDLPVGSVVVASSTVMIG
jgi:uncharacterized Zn-binding protein involved in type VI secretion